MCAFSSSKFFAFTISRNGIKEQCVFLEHEYTTYMYIYTWLYYKNIIKSLRTVNFLPFPFLEFRCIFDILCKKKNRKK